MAYASTEEKERLMNRAKCIICRSGYTSIMEIAELGKKHALFIPTPGQTEQEYLSWYYEKKSWFHSKSQYHLDLTEDIRVAHDPRYTGFPEAGRTGKMSTISMIRCLHSTWNNACFQQKTKLKQFIDEMVTTEYG